MLSHSIHIPHSPAIYDEVYGVGPLAVHGGLQHQFFCKIRHKYTQVKVFEALVGHYASFGTHFKLSFFGVASASLWVEPLINSKFLHFKMIAITFNT